MSDGAKMTGERSYSDLSDSATTFDPEEQFDRDIDERMKGMSKEDEVAKAISGAPFPSKESLRKARLAIAAADKWDAEQEKGSSPAEKRDEDMRLEVARALVDVTNRWIKPNFPLDHKLRGFDELEKREQRLNLDYADAAISTVFGRHSQPAISLSPGLDSAIQDELDHPPASIMEEGK